jgi:two-component system, NtrC family, response regulator AtoC
MPEHVLVVEDDRELREMLLDALRDAGYVPTGFARADAALQALERGLDADLVLTDLIMPGIQGHQLMGTIRQQRPELNVVIMTAFGSIDSAIDLVKAGAYDYLTKPLAIDDLLLAVERGLQESEHRRVAAKWSRSAAKTILPGFIGASPPMTAMYPLIAKAALSPHSVLIAGESGTGKELVARALHQASGRRAFVTVNCGALPETLLESELFGHEKGAFTGADRDKDGLFQVADGGTLFLDEIAELSLPLQPKLLRALEHSEVRRVGSTQPRTVNVRVVAATNRDLEQEVRLGRFRDDLFWRLNVLHITVPPLRERTTDISILADHFLARAGEEGRIPARPGTKNGHSASAAAAKTIAPETMALLLAYPWPGNVRELRNAIHRAATLSNGPTIQPGDLPERIQQAGQATALVASSSRRHLTIRELERMYIIEVLRQSNGNKSRAAELLGLDRKTLYRKLEEYRAEDPSLTL